MKSKKASSSTEVPIWLLLALLVATFIVILFLRKSGQVVELSMCENNGGVLVSDSCDASVANHFFVGDDEDGNQCCKKKATVSQDTYDAWVKTAPVVSGSSDSGTGGIPVRTSGTIEDIRIIDSKLEEDDARLLFNGKITPEDEPFIVPASKNFVLSATHNIKEGNYCELYVVEAEVSGVPGYSPKRSSAGTIIVLDTLTQKNSHCAPNETITKQLQINSAISRSGYYMAYYIVKEESSGDVLGREYVTFEVSSASSGEDTSLNLPPTITITKSQDSRQQKIYCWVQVAVETYGQELSNSLEIYTGKTTQECAQANYKLLGSDTNPEELGADTYCIKAEQSYTDTLGIDRTRVEKKNYESSECDFVQVFEKTQPLISCQDSCEDYNQNGKINSCLGSRTQDCQYSLDCYQRTLIPGTTPGANSCRTCDSTITDCSSYNNKESCEANQCLSDQRCQWNKGLPWGKCSPLYDSVST